jgi:hypothetical protein
LNAFDPMAGWQAGKDMPSIVQRPHGASAQQAAGAGVDGSIGEFVNHWPLPA